MTIPVEPIIDEVVTGIYKQYPELTEKYGEAGRQKCRKDNWHHFDHLETAYEVNDVVIFTDYALWLHEVLTARGMKTDHLIDNFTQIQFVLKDKLDNKRECFYIETLMLAIIALKGKNDLKEKWKLFAEHLLNGDEQGAYQLITGEDKDSLSIYIEIVTPAMQYIGKLWKNDDITVAEEHLATSVCDFVLSLYGFQFKTNETTRKGKIMFLCLEKEQHMLGTKMAASLCEEKQWDVKLLGANLPLEYALSMAKKWKPDIIGLSASIPYRLPLLENYITELEDLEHHPKVIVGGRLASMYDLYKYASEKTMIFKNLFELDHWLDEFHKEGKVNRAI